MTSYYAWEIITSIIYIYFLTLFIFLLNLNLYLDYEYEYKNIKNNINHIKNNK